MTGAYSCRRPARLPAAADLDVELGRIAAMTIDELRDLWREARGRVPVVSAVSLAFLALLGAIGAKAGGANVLRATFRVTFWGALAMALTASIGKIFGTVV